MSFGFYPFARRVTLSLFYTLSCAGVLSGVLMCLMTSPESQSLNYLVLAEQYQNQAALAADSEALALLKKSENAVLTALSFTPYKVDVWDKLSGIQKEYVVLSRPNKEQDFALSHIE